MESKVGVNASAIRSSVNRYDRLITKRHLLSHHAPLHDISNQMNIGSKSAGDRHTHSPNMKGCTCCKSTLQPNYYVDDKAMHPNVERGEKTFDNNISGEHHLSGDACCETSDSASYLGHEHSRHNGASTVRSSVRRYDRMIRQRHLLSHHAPLHDISNQMNIGSKSTDYYVEVGS